MLQNVEAFTQQTIKSIAQSLIKSIPQSLNKSILKQSQKQTCHQQLFAAADITHKNTGMNIKLFVQNSYYYTSSCCATS